MQKHAMDENSCFNRITIRQLIFAAAAADAAAYYFHHWHQFEP